MAATSPNDGPAAVDDPSLPEEEKEDDEEEETAPEEIEITEDLITERTVAYLRTADMVGKLRSLDPTPVTAS